MSEFPLTLDAQRCLQCGVCIDACGYGALTMNEYPEIDPEACRLCGSCVEACPAGALVLTAVERERDTQAQGIWVLAESRPDGTSDPVTAELLGEARRLAETAGESVSALLVGPSEAGDRCRELFEQGADRVYLAPCADAEVPEENRWATVVAAVAARYRPSILLIGATRFGRGVAARVAASLGTGLTADCTRLSIDPQSGNLLQQRPAFGGNLLATIVTPDHRPQMASVRPGVMKAIAPRSGFVGEITLCEVPAVGPSAVEIVASRLNETRGSSIADARIVVGGGRGMQCAANMALLQELADVLGGSVAGSRAAVEAGWIGFENQVGQTGRSIAPDLYIACGISGQIQHTAGLTGAGTIVAINNDPAAPIFSVADYGIVGDVTDVLPRLIAALRA